MITVNRKKITWRLKQANGDDLNFTQHVSYHETYQNDRLAATLADKEPKNIIIKNAPKKHREGKNKNRDLKNRKQTKSSHPLLFHFEQNLRDFLDLILLPRWHNVSSPTTLSNFSICCLNGGREKIHNG